MKTKTHNNDLGGLTPLHVNCNKMYCPEDKCPIHEDTICKIKNSSRCTLICSQCGGRGRIHRIVPYGSSVIVHILTGDYYMDINSQTSGGSPSKRPYCYKWDRYTQRKCLDCGKIDNGVIYMNPHSLHYH